MSRWVLILLLVPTTAQGQTRVHVEAGVAAFFNSQSIALGHLLKPQVRLEIERDYTADIRIGVEIVSVIAGSGYRLTGGYVTVAPALYRGELYRLDLVAGVGLGLAPAILSENLTDPLGTTVWSQTGLRNRWDVGVIQLGLDLVFEHLSVVSLTGGLGLRF